MTMRQRLHDLTDAIRYYPYRNAQDSFSRLNPTLNRLHPNSLIDYRAAHALEDENDPYEPPAQRRRVIEDRAIQAEAIASKREHDRQETFTRLNPDFGVLPDSHDPDQHRFAQQRERALALGQRVAAAEQSGGARRAIRHPSPRASAGGASRSGTLTMTKAASTIHQTRRDRRVPIDHRRLPAAPLIEMVHGAARRRQEPLEELLGGVDGPYNPWLLAALRQAETSGAVTVLTGEHFCDVLGWHPRMVWGDTYDATISDTTPHTAPAPPGTPTAWRQGCRCLDCREANRDAVARSAGRHRPGGERPV